MRQRNLSKQCLLRFLCLSIKIFAVCAVRRFKNCNTKLDHEERLSSSIFEFAVGCDIYFRQLWNHFPADSVFSWYFYYVIYRKKVLQLVQTVEEKNVLGL